MSARIAPPPTNSSQARLAISAAAVPCGLSSDCTPWSLPGGLLFYNLDLCLVQCESDQETEPGDEPAVVVCGLVGLGDQRIGQHRENSPGGNRIGKRYRGSAGPAECQLADQRGDCG